MKNSLRSSVLCALALLALSQLSADTIVLKNGDTLSGKIVEETDDSVVLESPVLGSLTLPKAEVESLTKEGDEAADVPEKEEEPAPDVAEESVSQAYWDAITETIFPEGFTGEILIAYDYSESSDVQSGIKLGLAGAYEAGKHKVEGDIFYAYTRKKDADGNVTKPTDRYGFNAAYEYDIQEPFFLRASDKFVIDRVKKLEPQNDLNGLFGWRAVDEEMMALNLAIGPGVRYQKTPTTDGKWNPLFTFNQDAFYQYSDLVRFDQLFDYSIDPSDTGEYSLLFELSASIRLTPFAEPKIIYRNSYDSSVGEGGVKREQSLLIALTVPL